MKVGDLVKAKDDLHNLCGMAIVYDKDGRHLIKVHWFEEVLNDRESDWWSQATHFEVINEKQV